MRPYLSLVALSILSATATTAEPSEARHLIDRMLRAMGGREAIGSLRSLAVDADCSGPDGEFRTRVESFLPGSTYFEQVAGDAATEIWSTEGRTWHLGADGTDASLGPEVRDFVRAHEFHFLLFDVESRFSHHVLGDAISVEGEPCRLVEMTDGAGRPASVCVAEESGLPLRLEMNPAGAEGPIRITFDDWRTLGGVRFFHAFRLTEGPDRTFTYAYRAIEPNAAAADRFVAPAPPSQRAEQEALLEVLRRDRRAHLETNAELIASSLADRLIEVSNGEVSVRSRSEVRAMFEGMFDGAEYSVWEDADVPVIRISPEATMAWVARKVRVRRSEMRPDGSVASVSFASAYTSTYEKQGGEWKMTSVTSTFAPGPASETS